MAVAAVDGHMFVYYILDMYLHSHKLKAAIQATYIINVIQIKG